ncbi:MAG: ATP-binding protein, partial [Bdellovibrio sp.]|nr:ATP-binding protein [Bdellovibrio sp.]
MAIDNYHRILKKTEHSSFFLFGVRGSGKSTWTSKLPKIAKTINLLNEELYQKILLNPVYFTGEIESLASGAWVVVDEIQRAPFLLNEIHRFIEEKKLKFILTGSSARKLRRAGVNLLAGRALVREMYPLLPEEMGKDFNLEKTLRFGTVALIIASEADPSERLKAYVQTYLKEEIRAEALVRNLQGFVRFLPVAALFHAQVINVSGVSRDVGVERTTVEGFLDVLEDTLFTFR